MLLWKGRNLLDSVVVVNEVIDGVGKKKESALC